MNPTNSFTCRSFSPERDACRDCALFFDAMKFLARAGIASQPLQFRRKQVLFAEGSSADSVLYICSGRVRLAAVSQEGKEATIALLGPGDFAGDDCIAELQPIRTTTATALSECCILRIHRGAMMQVMNSEPRFLAFFLSFVMGRKIRMQEDLLHQLCSSSEQRLARVLLLLAGIEGQDDAETAVPRLSHEMLAEMVGTTRARVTFFMNHFREQGLIDYDGDRQGDLLIRSTLFSVVSAGKGCERCRHDADANSHCCESADCISHEMQG
jgi:CRP/FNR family transcriptional regulator, cyclic AMP receptor protein